MSFVQERERRPNAGSRMRALLDQEEDVEELFEYKENDEEDEEFSTQAEEEEDKLDSDFDLDSSEGEQEHAEEGQALDKELEKAEKKARRAAFNPPPSVVTTAAKKPSESRKRKKVDIAETIEDGDRSTRHSSRKNTMLNRILVEDQIREQNKRKALQVKRDRPVEKKWTQEELLAEAAVTEEQNKDSLLEWQLKEAERKENAKKKDKKGITGPFVRYHSFVDGVYDEQIKTIMLSEQQQEGDIRMGERESDEKSTTEQGDTQEVVTIVGKAEDDSIEKLARNFVTFVEFDEYPYEDVESQVMTDKDLDLVDLVNQLSNWLEKEPKPNKPTLCPITGEPAKYRDPQTSIPFANIRTYNIIKSCFRHEMNWSPNMGLYLGNLPCADGVPKGWNSMMN